MTASLAENLLATGPRVIALPVERGYRDARAEELEAPLARSVRCSHCARKGCPRCQHVGWTIEHTRVLVPVPQGATPGTRVTVEGAGDELGGAARPVIVEIVDPGPRADELRAAQADFEGKLETAWAMERAAIGGRRRKRGIALGVAIVLLLFIPVGRWLAKPTAGEPCTKASDCRSNACMRLMIKPLSWQGPARVDMQVCTASCTTDQDCPVTMGCRDPATVRAPVRVLDAPEGRVCIPHAY